MNKLSQNTPYNSLSPEAVLDAVEAVGYKCTGAQFALNSYENRVYDIQVEDEENIVVKFYRPSRWTKEQIQEEHAFAFQLEEAEVPVIAPLDLDGESIFESKEGYLYAIYPKRAGRSIEVTKDEDLRHMGRLVARIHSIGNWEHFKHRPRLNVDYYGWQNLIHLRQSGHIPADMIASYDATVTQLLTKIDELWKRIDFPSIRLHGDCHLGNILRDGDIFFVDLDDSMQGPAVQDLWLFATGEKQERMRQFGLLIEGYQQIRDFNFEELQLVESLRALRMIHYTAWISRRWEDPTFPKNFPHFQTQEYWQQHLQSLREQIPLIDEPTLVAI